MKDIIAAVMFAAASLQGGPGAPSTPALADISDALLNSHNSVAVGYCAKLPAGGADDDILFGAYTTAPVGVNGFINIGNKWCGLRSTGKTVACPAPVPASCPDDAELK